MADVKWIKVSTDMFNSSRKIKQIEVMPEGDAILVIWLKLLLLAGNINDGGAIYLTPEIPYTDEMLANELRRPINTVRLALSTFEHFGMVEIIDDILHLSSWEKYQSTDKLAELREKDRERKRIKRAQQKNTLSEFVHGQSTDSPSIDREEDLEKELLTISLAREKNEAVENSVDIKDIGEASPPSSTTVPTLNDVIDFVNDNGLSVNAYRFFNYYNEKGFLTLSGQPMDWKAKILEWDTEDKKKRRKPASSEQNSSFELDEFFRATLERSEREYKKLLGQAAVDSEGARLAKDGKKK